MKHHYINHKIVLVVHNRDCPTFSKFLNSMYVYCNDFVLEFRCSSRVRNIYFPKIIAIKISFLIIPFPSSSENVNLIQV